MDHLNMIISILLMSLAISMDAFSVSLSLGMQNVRLKKIVIFGSVIGVFHLTLPLMGIIIGQYISTNITFITELTGGFILILIGSHMIFSSIQVKSPSSFPQQGWKLLLVAFFVSIDSFPAGLSFGMFAISDWYVVISFGVTAMVLSWTGMLVGKRVHVQIGKYSEIMGGLLLFTIGLYIIFW